MATQPLFDVVMRHRNPPADPRHGSLIAVAHALHRRGMAPSYGPGDHSNVSYRITEGCMIAARETSKANLRAEQLVGVIGCEWSPGGIRITCDGATLPSTDAAMRWEIYSQRPDVHAIIHGHDARMLAKAQAVGAPVTRTSARENSRALIHEVKTLSARHDYVVTRDHGFIAWGPTLEAVLAHVLCWSDRARSLK